MNKANGANEINGVIRITKAFEGKKALIAYIIGGDPNIETTEELIIALANSGVDIIKIGIPFSDPSAEDLDAQSAHERALKNGCTTDSLFEMIKRVRETVKIPLLFVTYINPVFVYETDRFFDKCVECGIDGIIVPDIPFEEKDELTDVCSKTKVAQISSIALNSNKISERMENIARYAEGFIYCVSGMNIDASDMVSEIKKNSPVPCVVDWGMATTADGFVIGKEIIKLVGQYGRHSVDPVKEFVKEIAEKIK